ncbi:MAG TPA: GerMN domain-containing protein [Leptolyngbyaceae cyanobacterium M33_DOE_097]|uniref:GerMN domain-containing protein n=1 Tax=Oscillatoriales cyanobacterium SpSt-418 TaxID=2282169 RepID=A0A7C3KH98_9CYAN|nr:GerMN domain-containing protein [Leptolyngbyaceae cyanobacterium M33_DOE_097]
MSKIRTSIAAAFLGVIATTSLQLVPTAAIANPVSAAAPRAQRVKVFLPKYPEQNNNLSYVAPVWRQAQTPSVAQFAVSQVIAGPNAQEKRAGFTAPIQLRGASSCGKDFTLAIAANKATLRFCREVLSAGIGDDARILSSLTATLKQFPNVRSVAILDRNGDCLGDMSGENRCLRR